MWDPSGAFLIFVFIAVPLATIVCEGLQGEPMTKIAKALVAALTALGTWGATAMDDSAIQGAEWFGLCGVLVAGLVVWAVPNSQGD